MDVLLLSLFILSILFILTNRPKRRTQQLEAEEAYLSELTDEIAIQEGHLQVLYDKIQSNQPNTRANLSELVEAILDQYNRIGIQLPADILEELAANLWNNETEIIAFIEQQRNRWKLENQKKGLK